MKCEYNEANQAFDKAIEIAQTVPEAWYNKGLVFYHQDKYDDAINAYDKAIQVKPDYANAYSDKAAALRHQGKREDAIKACAKAIELNPKLMNAWYQMINMLNEQGKYDEAQKVVDKAAALDPKMGKTLAKMSKVEWYRDDTKMTYVAIYDSVEKAAREANYIAQYGWMAQGTSATEGHSNLGTIGTSVFLFGNLGLLTAGSRTKGKVTITYVRTPEWLKAKNPVANAPTQDTQTNDQNDVIVLIERLAKLKEQGALTEEEFQAQKKKILST